MHIPDWAILLGLLGALVLVLRGRGRRLGRLGSRWPAYVIGWLVIIVILAVIYRYVWTPF